MVCIRVLDTLYSLLGNWLRDHASWALSGIGVKIKSLPKNFWSSVFNFTIPRYAFLFLNFETYIVHVINCEWSKSVNFFAAYVLYAIQTCIFPTTLMKLSTTLLFIFKSYTLPNKSQSITLVSLLFFFSFFLGLSLFLFFSGCLWFH